MAAATALVIGTSSGSLLAARCWGAAGAFGGEGGGEHECTQRKRHRHRRRQRRRHRHKGGECDTHQVMLPVEFERRSPQNTNGHKQPDFHLSTVIQIDACERVEERRSKVGCHYAMP